MAQAEDNAAAEVHSGRVTFRRLLGYTGRYKGMMLIGAFGMLLDGLAQPLFYKLNQYLIDRVFGDKDLEFGYMVAAAIATLGVVRIIGNYLGVYYLEWVGKRIVADLRQELFASYLRLPASYLDQKNSGDLISRLTYNLEQVANAVTTTIVSAGRDVVIVVGSMIVMFSANAKLSASVLVMVPIIALVVKLVNSKFRKLSKRVQTAMGGVSDVTSEAVNAHRVIKVFSGQQQEQQRFNATNENARRFGMRLVGIRLISSSVTQAAAILALMTVLLISLQPTMLESISPGVFSTIFIALIASIPPLKRISNVQEQIGKSIAAAESVFELIDQPGEVDEGTALIENTRGELEFQNVSFAYTGDETVLENINLHLPAGTVTALVGHSGSGKSTMANMVARFFNQSQGKILLDGVDIADISLASLRQNISLVSQDVVLFDDSIANNIAYGELAGASREKIIVAARAANALEFIERLPDGLDTRVGANGAALSGGQRQRIAIARALLKDAPILILDEATSALDSQSEHVIHEALNKLMANRTTLVIAHRLSTIEHADQIVVLEDGKIVEQGSHKLLLAKQGLYAGFYRRQTEKG
ncbi:MAG: lipid A export permease/ATP-binding protein MsbA [Xanthomonadales bacterium]|nr:lipid A export permease/ATP-binding protein MsbA [Xanthomonadales bacterium]